MLASPKSIIYAQAAEKKVGTDSDVSAPTKIELPSDTSDPDSASIFTRLKRLLIPTNFKFHPTCPSLEFLCCSRLFLYLKVLTQSEGSVFPQASKIAFPVGLLAALLQILHQENSQQQDSSDRTFLSNLSFKIPPPASDTQAFSGFSFFVGFVIVFRTSQAYSRYWEGVSEVKLLRGEWSDFCCCISAFLRYGAPALEKLDDSNETKDNSETLLRLHQIKTFKSTLVRLMCMLHASCLKDLSTGDEIEIDETQEILKSIQKKVLSTMGRDDDDDEVVDSDNQKNKNSDLSLVGLGWERLWEYDIGSLSDPSFLTDQQLERLHSTQKHLRSHILFVWLQHLIVDEGMCDEPQIGREEFEKEYKDNVVKNKRSSESELDSNSKDLSLKDLKPNPTPLLSIPPPLLSRSLQQLGNGMVHYHRAMRVSHTPFPFPYNQACDLLLLLQWLLIPIITSQQPLVSNAFWAFVFSFIQVVVLYSLNLIAQQIEHPFGSDENDIDINELRKDFEQVVEQVVMGGVVEEGVIGAKKDNDTQGNFNLESGQGGDGPQALGPLGSFGLRRSNSQSLSLNAQIPGLRKTGSSMLGSEQQTLNHKSDFNQSQSQHQSESSTSQFHRLLGHVPSLRSNAKSISKSTPDSFNKLNTATTLNKSQVTKQISHGAESSTSASSSATTCDGIGDKIGGKDKKEQQNFIQNNFQYYTTSDSKQSSNNITESDDSNVTANFGSVTLRRNFNKNKTSNSPNKTATRISTVQNQITNFQSESDEPLRSPRKVQGITNLNHATVEAQNTTLDYEPPSNITGRNMNIIRYDTMMSSASNFESSNTNSKVSTNNSFDDFNDAVIPSENSVLTRASKHINDNVQIQNQSNQNPNVLKNLNPSSSKGSSTNLSSIELQFGGVAEEEAVYEEIFKG